MKIMLILFLMIGIGAIIGGFTNYLAIKMLFRPYKAIYIGKWHVPFTPGVIPNRRDELANQMGKMVVEHLLTPESIKKKFLHKGFQKEILDMVITELKYHTDLSLTPKELIRKIGINNPTERIELKMDIWLENIYEKNIEKYRDKPIKIILTPDIIEKIEAKIPNISRLILQKGINFFLSQEGKVRVQKLLDDFLKERGMLGNMLQMLLGNVNLVDKIQPEIIKFLANEGTEELLSAILKQEWRKLIEYEISHVEETIEKEKIITAIKSLARKATKIDYFMNQPLKEITLHINTNTMETVTVHIVDLLGEWLIDKLDNLFERLRLKDVVREQVESFSVDRLEKMVLSIIQSELRMITYLGCILGGIIGLFQGIIMILIQ